MNTISALLGLCYTPKVVHLVLLATVLLLGCGRVGFDSLASADLDSSSDAGGSGSMTTNGKSDSGIDAAPVGDSCDDKMLNGEETGVDCGGPECPACRCENWSNFSNLQVLPPTPPDFTLPTLVAAPTGINSENTTMLGGVSPNELFIAVSHNGGASTVYDIYVASRSSKTDMFSTPVAAISPALYEPSENSFDQSAYISNDGLLLIFTSLSRFNTSNENGAYEIFVATRSNTTDSFSDIKNFNDWAFGTDGSGSSQVNTFESEYVPHLSADGLSFYYEADRSGESKIFACTRADTTQRFDNCLSDEVGSVLENLYGVPALPDLCEPTLTENGLELFFSNCSGEIYHATRTKVSEQFSAPTIVPEATQSFYPQISGDGNTLYLNHESNFYSEGFVWSLTRNCLD